MPAITPITLLLVEDDEIDIETIKRGFEDLRIANPIRVARDGIEALEIMRGENGMKKIERPFLILLDINMPRMNGLEFLDAVRKDPELSSAIIFVLTTSNDDQDRIHAYRQHVAGYLLKSTAGQDFIEAARLLDHYWRYVEFPA